MDIKTQAQFDEMKTDLALSTGGTYQNVPINIYPLPNNENYALTSPLKIVKNNINIIGVDKPKFVMNTTGTDEVNNSIIDITGDSITGVFSSISSTTTFVKSSAGWTVNAYTGWVLIFKSGNALNQTRIISSNTVDTITVSEAFSVTPNGTSFLIYKPIENVIIKNLHLVGMGNANANGSNGINIANCGLAHFGNSNQWETYNRYHAGSIGVNKTTKVGVIIENCDIEECRTSGIRLTEVKNSRFSKNRIFNNNYYGINLNGYCIENLLYDNVIEKNVTGGGIRFHAQYCFSNNFVGNLIQNNGAYGILFATSYCNNNIFTSNTVQNNNNHGILLNTSDCSNIFTSNTVQNNNGSGIVVNANCFNNNFTANTIQYNYSTGIHLNNAYFNSITGNNINSNNEHGIRLYNSSYHNTVSGNIITNNGLSGVYLDSSSYRNAIASNNIYGNKDIGINVYGTTCQYNNIYGNTSQQNANGNLSLVAGYNNIASTSANNFIN